MNKNQEFDPDFYTDARAS